MTRIHRIKARLGVTSSTEDPNPFLDHEDCNALDPGQPGSIVDIARP